MVELTEFFITSSVLIIGDDRRGSCQLQSLLDLEMQLIYAANSDEVINVSSDVGSIDLVLIDIESLKDRSYEMCMWLKTDDTLNHMPVFMMGSENEDFTVWLNAGACDFIINTTPPLLSLARIKSQLELKYKTDLLSNLVSLDGLTTLSNKNRLNEYVNLEWRRSLREYYPLSLIKIDVDYFSAFNDQYGRGCGDECLKRIARALEGCCLRAADMLSRYDADEFIVLLPGLELDNAMIVAQNMVKAVAGLKITHACPDVCDYLTVSAGLVTIEPSRDNRYQDLFDEVNEVLYEAQQAGGNQVKGLSL